MNPLLPVKIILDQIRPHTRGVSRPWDSGKESQTWCSALDCFTPVAILHFCVWYMLNKNKYQATEILQRHSINIFVFSLFFCSVCLDFLFVILFFLNIFINILASSLSTFNCPISQELGVRYVWLLPFSSLSSDSSSSTAPIPHLHSLLCFSSLAPFIPTRVSIILTLLCSPVLPFLPSIFVFASNFLLFWHSVYLPVYLFLLPLSPFLLAPSQFPRSNTLPHFLSPSLTFTFTLSYPFTQRTSPSWRGCREHIVN